MIFKVKKIWPILLILILACLLRIYKLEELFYFTYDESVPAFVGRRLILWHHIPLIGGVTPFGFHLAPYFYWFLSIILWIGNLNPLAWGSTAALISIFTTYLFYKVGSSLSSKKVGFTVAVIWSFSYIANIYDRHLWALYWGPMLSLITLFCLINIIKGREKFVYILSIALALGLASDPSNLVFVFLAIIAWIFFKVPFKKSTLVGIFIIIFSFLPLAIFDLRHNFANIKPFFEFWQTGKNNPQFEISRLTQNTLIFPRAFLRLIYPFVDNEIAKQYSYCPSFIQQKYQVLPALLVLFSLLIIITFIIWSFKYQQNVGWRLIAILIILYYLGIQLYGTVFQADIFEHYLTGLFAVFLLIIENTLSKFSNKPWLAILAVFVFLNLYKLSTAQNNHGLKYKKQAVEFTSNNIKNQKFSLESHSSCWRFSGYRYLFAAYGQEPVRSYVDPNFSYLYGTTPVSEKHAEIVVAIVTHDFVSENKEFYVRYAKLKAHEIKSQIFGNIEVIIMDNSKDWFE